MKAKFQMLLIVMAMLLLPSVSKAQDVDMFEILATVVKEMNAECPMAVDDDVTISSFALNHQYLIMNMKFTSDEINFNSFDAEGQQLLKSLILNMVKGDEDMKTLQEICAMAGCDFKINLYDKFGACLDLVIPRK